MSPEQRMNRHWAGSDCRTFLTTGRSPCYTTSRSKLPRTALSCFRAPSVHPGGSTGPISNLFGPAESTTLIIAVEVEVEDETTVSATLRLLDEDRIPETGAHDQTARMAQEGTKTSLGNHVIRMAGAVEATREGHLIPIGMGPTVMEVVALQEVTLAMGAIAVDRHMVQIMVRMAHRHHNRHKDEADIHRTSHTAEEHHHMGRVEDEALGAADTINTS